MIVVEGPDGSGKTGLVESIVDQFGAELIPRAVNSGMDYTTDLCVWTENSINRGNGLYVYDRHQLISHLMYGPTIRRQLYGYFQDPVWLKDRLEKFWKLEPIVIVCLPPLETVIANVKTDDTSKKALPDIEVFWWNYYIWYCQNYKRPYVSRYDYTTTTWDGGSAKDITLRMIEAYLYVKGVMRDDG